MCKKEASLGEHQVHVVSEEVKRVQGFIERATDPTRTQDLVYHTQEEALFLLEAAMNYGAIDPEAKAGELKFDDFTTQVTLTNDKVTDEDLTAAFNDLRDQFFDHALEIGYKMLVADVEGHPQGNGVLEFKATRVSGVEPEALGEPDLQTSYQYNYRNRTQVLLPPCNPTLYAADRVLQHRINSAIGTQTMDYILSDVQIWKVLHCVPVVSDIGTAGVALDLANRILPASLFPNPNDPDGVDTFALNAWNDYRTYVRVRSLLPQQAAAAEPACLSPAAMSYLTQSAWDLMHEVKDDYSVDNSASLVPVSCSVKGYPVQEQLLPNGFSHWSFGHNVHFIYGRWLYTGPRN